MNILFTDVERLIRHSFLDANVDRDHVRTSIVHIQDGMETHVTGSCLHDRLKKMICSGEIELEENERYKVLLTDYLFMIFVYGVPMELAVPTTYKDRNAGRVQITDVEHYTHANMNDIRLTNDFYKKKVDYYIHRAKRFICENRDCFSPANETEEVQP